MSSITSSRQANPLNYTRKEYGHYYLSANQTTNINAGDPLKFDTCAIGNIAFNPTTYTWTLKANRTYKMKAEVQIGTDQATAYICIQWRTTAGTDIGNSTQAFPTTMASNIGNVQVATSIYTPTVDTDVRCCIDLISHVTTIYGGAFSTAGAAYAEITEIDTFSPNTQKWDYAYVSPRLDLSVTGGAGFALTYGIGVFYKTSSGNWYLQFNVSFTQTTSTTADFTIASIATSKRQACSAVGDSHIAYTAQCMSQGTSDGKFYGRLGTTDTSFTASGFIELDGKPTGYAIPSDV